MTPGSVHAGVKPVAGLCMAGAARLRDLADRPIRRRIMPAFSPELVQTMRAVLEEVMAKVPLQQATPEIKTHVAQCILKAAAEGQTSHESLIAAAANQLSTIIATFGFPL